MELTPRPSGSLSKMEFVSHLTADLDLPGTLCSVDRCSLSEPLVGPSSNSKVDGGG